MSVFPGLSEFYLGLSTSPSPSSPIEPVAKKLVLQKSDVPSCPVPVNCLRLRVSKELASNG